MSGMWSALNCTYINLSLNGIPLPLFLNHRGPFSVVFWLSIAARLPVGLVCILCFKRGIEMNRTTNVILKIEHEYRNTIYATGAVRSLWLVRVHDDPVEISSIVCRIWSTRDCID